MLGGGASGMVVVSYCHNYWILEESFAQCRDRLQKELFLFPARRQSGVYSLVNEHLPTTLGAKRAFLQRSLEIFTRRGNSIDSS